MNNLDLNTDFLKIDNVRIYGLEESIAASGLPKKEKYDKDEFQEASLTALAPESKDLSRITKLASIQKSGHDNALLGITVQCNITAPLYWWPEFQRYHFEDIFSSTSTVHKLVDIMKNARSAGDLVGRFSLTTPLDMVTAFYEYAKGCIKLYELCESDPDAPEAYVPLVETLKSMLPGGWLQTARITTNYRQLVTIYDQRHDHPLLIWKQFCRWLEKLPLSYLITKKKTE